jgi:hypothetical protein
MIGLDAGAAWASLSEAAGRLRGVFSRAVHVQLGARLLVVVDAGGTSGPLHLRVDALPVLPRGAEVRVDGGRLELGRSSIDLRSVPAWTPPPVGGPPRAHLLPGVQTSALADCRDLLDRVGALVGRDDLDAVARLLGGRGPGLTPAGDDVLTGYLLGLRALTHVSPSAGPIRAAAGAGARDAGWRTTALAATLVRHADVGEAADVAADLVDALVDGVPLDRPLRRLVRTGHTSGRDLAEGLLLAWGIAGRTR